MEILEWVGRIAAMVIPFFYRMEAQSAMQTIAIVVMVVTLVLYYACWARYFARGRQCALLFEPFLGVPLPMAISPIVYFSARQSFSDRGTWHWPPWSWLLGTCGSASRIPERYWGGRERSCPAGWCLGSAKGAAGGHDFGLCEDW
jgi:hypothetical protein